MKKLIFSAAVLASAFFAASCQQEMLAPQAEGNTVTYTVEVPVAIATKAIGDQVTNVDKVYYEVYRAADVEDLSKAPIFEGSKSLTDNQASFSLEFLKNQEFVVLFWAQNSALVNTDITSATGMYNINDLRAIKLVNPGASNNTAAQVFAGKDTVTDCESAANGRVTLTRPVSQINVYTTSESLSFEDVTVELETSSMKVTGLYNTFNVARDAAVVSDENMVPLTYSGAAVPTVAADDADLTYVAMNYVGFAPHIGATVNVDFTIQTTETNPISHSVSNVPVKPNYRTNIVGNLLTATADYNVTLNNNWTDAGKDMEVLADGVVKNINGDYEISTAVGFAYAINKLFADGGTFYIHPGRYDFKGLVVVPQPTKRGTILNVKANEKPVVTRSTSGFEIIGLDVAYLVSEVTDGSQAIFSNLVLPEDTKLVGTNNGVVGISGCSNEQTSTPAELIEGGSGEVVNTASMDSVEEINAAIAKNLKLIELTADMSLTETLVISKENVTLDGCGHTLTSTAARAINVSGAEGVTIKNLVIECTGERAINIIQNSTNVTIDNVTARANNYTVNVAASAPNAEVNIENSTLNGLCTVNVSAESAIVKVDNSTINCNDNNTTVGESYSALSLNRDAVGGKIIATNTVVNVAEGSDSHKGRNGAENGVVTINGSTDGVVVMVAAIIYPNSDNYHALESLDDAIEFAQGNPGQNGVITLIRDITVEKPVTIENGQTVVLDLNGKTLSNTSDYVFENYSELTISGEGSIAGLGGIRSHSGKVTINGGTYTASSSWKNSTYQHILKAVNTMVTINGGVFTPTVSEGSNAMINVSENSTVTINGGEFSNVVEGEVIPQFAPYMFTYEKNGKLIITDGSFYGGWRFNGETATTDIYGGDFTVSYDGQSFHANSTHVLKVYGGTFSLQNGGKLDPSKHVAEDYKAVQNTDGKWEVVAKTYVAQIGEQKYESLQEAFNAGGKITLLRDVTISETATLADGKTAVLDLNGKTITGTMHKSVGAVVENNGTLTIQNGTISSTAANGGSAVMNKGTLKVEDVTLNGAPNADGSWPSYTVNNTAVMTANNTKFTSYHGSVSSYGEGAVVTLNNSEIDMAGIPGFTSHGIYTYNGGKVVVNGGTYANKATDQVASGASVINGAVEVNAGTFTGRIENYYGTPVLKGGTYSVKPNDNFLADGYKAQQDGKVWNVVQE